MSRKQKDPLRRLKREEKECLEQISRSRSEPAGQVERAKIILAVANGSSYTDAALAVGRQSNDAVANLVARFNKEGLNALEARHGGGPQPIYNSEERERILNEARRVPDREVDGTATWSLTTLQRALRKAALPEISTYTIWKVLTDAGWGWQKNRTRCETGTAVRKRKSGYAKVTDVDSEAKKS